MLAAISTRIKNCASALCNLKPWSIRYRLWAYTPQRPTDGKLPNATDRVSGPPLKSLCTVQVPEGSPSIAEGATDSAASTPTDSILRAEELQYSRQLLQQHHPLSLATPSETPLRYLPGKPHKKVFSFAFVCAMLVEVAQPV